MGRRVNVPEITMGRDTERTEGAEKVQIHVGGEIPVVHSLPGTVKYRSTILLLPCVLI